MSMGLASADRPHGRDRADIGGAAAFSASREGKRLNMLGFNSHLLDRGDAQHNQIQHT